MDDYSGRIDWDAIYRAFHDPADVAGRVLERLRPVDGPLTFCGFPETASTLARHVPVTLVDGSAAVCTSSRARHPGIGRVVHADVVDHLGTSRATSVALCCRVSAFWQTPAALEALADAVLAHPREQVLIDCFDRDAVEPGRILRHRSGADTVSWRIGGFEPVPVDDPVLHVADVRVDHVIGGVRSGHDARRAFHRRATLVAWCERVLPGWSTIVSGPLIRDDPSFCVHLTRGTG